MKYYGYLVVAGCLTFNDHKRTETLRGYNGGASVYEVQRVLVMPGVERNGTIDRFWHMNHLAPRDIQFPESVEEIVESIESEARSSQCHLVWSGKNRNIHDFGYAMRAARSLVQTLCNRAPRKKFLIVPPEKLNLRNVEEFSHSCAKYQKSADKERKTTENDVTEQ